jgi:hypothetical protein
MKLCGRKTRDMFDRYSINDAANLARAVRRRFTDVATIPARTANKRQTFQRAPSRASS